MATRNNLAAGITLLSQYVQALLTTAREVAGFEIKGSTRITDALIAEAFRALVAASHLPEFLTMVMRGEHEWLHLERYEELVRICQSDPQDPEPVIHFIQREVFDLISSNYGEAGSESPFDPEFLQDNLWEILETDPGDVPTPIGIVVQRYDFEYTPLHPFTTYEIFEEFSNEYVEFEAYLLRILEPYIDIGKFSDIPKQADFWEAFARAPEKYPFISRWFRYATLPPYDWIPQDPGRSLIVNEFLAIGEQLGAGDHRVYAWDSLPGLIAEWQAARPIYRAAERKSSYAHSFFEALSLFKPKDK
jgi:hypothetical protein